MVERSCFATENIRSVAETVGADGGRCDGGLCFVAAVVVGVTFFFFQAEDGIRDVAVTGVQTCALPIFKAEGDSFWIVFPSVTAAARAAVTMQEELSRTQANRGDDRWAMRVAITLGD